MCGSSCPRNDRKLHDTNDGAVPVAGALSVRGPKCRRCQSAKMTTGSILLVDDEAKILSALAAALRTEGHEVVATGSAREAQGLLGQRLFDVLVVDNLMPELSGTDLIRDLV